MKRYRVRRARKATNRSPAADKVKQMIDGALKKVIEQVG